MSRGGRIAAVLAFALLATSCSDSGSAALSQPRARRASQTSAPMGDKACLILTEPAAENALVVNSGAQVQAPECEFHVDSRARPAATLNADSKLEVAALCVQGDIARKGGLVSAPLQGCAASLDPNTRRVAFDGPCDDRPRTVNGGEVTMQPGVYCGGLAFDGAPQVRFAPGLYVLKAGDWTFNGGDYVGEGVSFRFADTSRFVLNSGVSLDLAAPTAGPRAGLLIDEPAGLAPTTLTFNEARRAHLMGLIDLPSRRAVFNSGSMLTSEGLTMVFLTAELNATHWAIAARAPHP